MKIFKKKKDTREIEHIYTDKFKNKWYKYKHAGSMPNVRNLEAQIKAREAQNNITDENLKWFIDEMKKHGNKGRIVDLFGMLSEMERRLEAISDTEILLNLACVYFIMGQEDPDTWSRHWQNEKRKVWEQDEECRGFFLHEAFKTTHNYKDISKKDILTLLKEEEERRGTFYRMYRKSTSI